MEVNFYGPLRTVRAVLPSMRARGSGHIVLISSGAGYVLPVFSLSALTDASESLFVTIKTQNTPSPGTLIRS